mgnify:CR=1 FL=1
MASPDLDWDHSIGENLLIHTDDDDVPILEDGQSGVSFYNGYVCLPVHGFFCY